MKTYHMYNTDSINAESKLKEAEKQEEKQMGRSGRQDDRQTPRSPDALASIKTDEKPVRRSSVKKIEKMKEKVSWSWPGGAGEMKGTEKKAVSECPTSCHTVSWMIYEYTTGLLLTLSAIAGARHSNIILYFLLSVINTETFHSNTYHPFSLSTCHYPSSFLTPLSLSPIRDRQSTQRTSWRPSKPGMSTCWLLRLPTAASLNITSTTSPTLLMWV